MVPIITLPSLAALGRKCKAFGSLFLELNRSAERFSRWPGGVIDTIRYSIDLQIFKVFKIRIKEETRYYGSDMASRISAFVHMINYDNRSINDVEYELRMMPMHGNNFIAAIQLYDLVRSVSRYGLDQEIATFAADGKGPLLDRLYEAAFEWDL